MKTFHRSLYHPRDKKKRKKACYCSHGQCTQMYTLIKGPWKKRKNDTFFLKPVEIVNVNGREDKAVCKDSVFTHLSYLKRSSVFSPTIRHSPLLDNSHLLESCAHQHKTSFTLWTCAVDSFNNVFVNRDVFSSLLMSHLSSFHMERNSATMAYQMCHVD